MFVQATNTTLRDSNSFLEQQLADAEAQLAKLRTAPETEDSAAARPGGSAAAQPSSSTAAPPNGSADGNAASNPRSGDIPANVYELTEDGGSFRAAYAGEPSYKAMKRKLEANFKAQVRNMHQPHCRTLAHVLNVSGVQPTGLTQYQWVLLQFLHWQPDAAVAAPDVRCPPERRRCSAAGGCPEGGAAAPGAGPRRRLQR